MNLKTAAVNILVNIHDLMPCVAGVIAAVLIAFIVLMIMSHNTWVGKKQFRVVGLFFGLNSAQKLRLCCTFIRMVLIICFIILFKKLTLSEYFLLAIPSLIFVLEFRNPERIVPNFFWLALELAGLFAANVICGYILDVGAGRIFRLLYIFVGIFMILFSVYVFLMDVNRLSEERMMNLGKERDALFAADR